MNLRLLAYRQQLNDNLDIQETYKLCKTASGSEFMKAYVKSMMTADGAVEADATVNVSD